MMCPMRGDRSPDDQRVLSLGEPQYRGELAGTRRDPVQRAIEIEIVDARRAGREGTAHCQAIERAAGVRLWGAGIDAELGEQRVDRRVRRWARGHGDRGVQPTK